MLESLAALRSNARGFTVAAALALSLAALPASAASAGSADSGDRLHFVILSPGDRGSSSFDAGTDDFNRAQALRGGSGGLIYFRQDGAAYVIRDPDMLRRADAIMEPQRELGMRQGKLGARQGALGKAQGDLGAEQGRLGALQANATPEEQAELSQAQGQLGRMEGEFGAKQGELGEKQGELGREQARLSQIAGENLRSLVAEALQRGLAQRVE